MNGLENKLAIDFEEVVKTDPVPFVNFDSTSFVGFVSTRIFYLVEISALFVPKIEKEVRSFDGASLPGSNEVVDAVINIMGKVPTPLSLPGPVVSIIISMPPFPFDTFAVIAVISPNIPWPWQFRLQWSFYNTS